MPESQFHIFVDHHNLQGLKNVTRQPLSNIENMGKTVSSGPYKPNEPLKKTGEPKKTFLSNACKALQQNTPGRKVFSPRAVNVANMIYNDDSEGLNMEEIEFTRPKYSYDMHYKLGEFIEMLPAPVLQDEQCPPTPPPVTKSHSLDVIPSYEDDFFKDFSDDDLQDVRLDDDLGLPDLW